MLARLSKVQSLSTVMFAWKTVAEKVNTSWLINLYRSELFNYQQHQHSWAGRKKELTQSVDKSKNTCEHVISADVISVGPHGRNTSGEGQTYSIAAAIESPLFSLLPQISWMQPLTIIPLLSIKPVVVLANHKVDYNINWTSQFTFFVCFADY